MAALKTFTKCLGWMLLLLIGAIVGALLLAFWVYQPVQTGTLYLEHARGEAEILREVSTSIPHIYASNQLMAVYTQGLIHAQERLWQMERLRRTTQGRLSELFGEKTLGVDKFFRTIGIHSTAKAAFKNMDKDTLLIMEAYADGVNDFINNIDLMRPDATGRALPPEFYVLNHTRVEPWTPVDSLCILKLLNFHLSWNGG